MSTTQNIRSFAILDLETNTMPCYNFNKVSITEICIYGISSCDIIKGKTIFKETGDDDDRAIVEMPKTPRIMHKLNLVFNPQMLIVPAAETITGLSNYSVEHESAFNLNAAKMIGNFLKHLQQPVCLVAHNGWNFDFPILKEKLDKFDIDLPDNLVCVDTYGAFVDIDNKRDLQLLTLLEEARPVINPTESDEKEISAKENDSAVDKPKETIANLYDVLNENDKIDWQTKNETTPKRSVKYKELIKNKLSSKRCLNFHQEADSSNRPKRPRTERGYYKLGSIYERLFGEKIDGAHHAEADVKALTQIIQIYGEDFVNYSESLARPYADILKVGVRWADF